MKQAWRRAFSRSASNRVSVDMIIQNATSGGNAHVSFTFPGSQRDLALAAVDEIAKELNASEVFVDENIAKVSLVGTGMKSSPGVAACVQSARR